MRILHVIPSLDIEERGGAITAAISLSRNLSKKGVGISIFAASKEKDCRITDNFDGLKAKLFPKSPLSYMWTAHSVPLAGALKKAVFGFDLVHIHELWHYPGYAAYRAARYAGKPFIVTIHGELEPWRLGYKAVRKKIYLRLIQRKMLREAAAIHAITKNEADNIRKFTLNENVFYVPNGLDMDEFESLPGGERFEALHPEIKARKMILFLGRIHPMKRVDVLARSFCSILRTRRDVHLVIAGPDNDNCKNRIIETLERGNAMNNTTFTGMIVGDEKISALRRADIFVLPSHSEVLGLSTLEAMACEKPVIITEACNFPEVGERGAGRIVKGETEELSKAIVELLNDPGTCAEMGRRGRSLVRENYTWDKVADEMISVYEKIISVHAKKE